MATTGSSVLSSWSSFAEEHMDTAINVLTVIAPPAAILAKQGKGDLDGRQFLLSLALYCSFILYVPAVLHAYWLLTIREEGWEHWTVERKSQAETAWKTHLGPYVDPYVLQLTSFWDQIVDYAIYWRALAASYWESIYNKYEQITNFVRELKRKGEEVFEEAKEAYGDGAIVQWMGGYIKAAAEKVKEFAESFPRLQAIIAYFEQRVPILLQNIAKIVNDIKQKFLPSSSETVEVSRAPETSDSVLNGLSPVVAPALSTPQSHRGKKGRSNGHTPSGGSPIYNDSDISQEL